MDNKLKAYLQLHFVVLLYGLTAILGDLITLPAFSLVWWRVLITSFSLLILLRFGRSLMTVPRATILRLAGIGVIIALHWVTFYGAIKLSNASVALAAFASTSLFTSILEPMMTGRPFEKLELIIGILIVPAMVLIANNLDVTLLNGLWIGLFSAFLASIFSIMNKQMVGKASDYEISFIELFSAFCFLSLLMPFVITGDTSVMPVKTDWIYLLILSLGCTTLAFVINLKVLKQLTAFDTNLVINLEPVYGMLLAAVILKEHKELTPHFYIGVVIILILVFSHPFLKKYQSNV